MADRGHVDFAADIPHGIVRVSVRSPLGIESVSADVTLLDFLDTAATIMLELNKVQRAVLTRLRNDMVANHGPLT